MRPSYHAGVKPETSEWIEVADHDIRASRVMLDEGLFQQTVFYCQQSIEKLLKAIWTEQQGVGTHPRVHNLVKLAEGLDLDVPAEHHELLVDLTDQVFPSRYPEPGWRYNREIAEEYYNRTLELYSWLRRHLT
jgi:HEPN domain-containing protein